MVSLTGGIGEYHRAAGVLLNFRDLLRKQFQMAGTSAQVVDPEVISAYLECCAAGYSSLRLTMVSPNTIPNVLLRSKYRLYLVTHLTQAFGGHKTGI